MLPSHFINICLFSNSPFYSQCHISPQPTLALSPSLFLCLSTILSSCPLFRFDIKLTGSCVFDDQLNKRFSTAHCSHFKGNINMKLRKKGNMALVPGGVSSGLEVFCSRVGVWRVSAESLSTAVAGSILSSSTPNGSDSPA
jgi:hypothetical protein